MCAIEIEIENEIENETGSAYLTKFDNRASANHVYQKIGVCIAYLQKRQVSMSSAIIVRYYSELWS